jgi:hypothetical protein
VANIQDQIIQYDDAIRLTRYDENAKLREKRDRVLDKLRARFTDMRKEGREVPYFRTFNQGSYKMGTGIAPENGDYDIDVGLDFNVEKTKYENPVDLKALVHEALDGHTQLGTVVRRSCVTVKYKVDGEQAYHVDLAVYACDDPEAESRTLYLARGKLNSRPEHRSWDLSDPKGLTKWVADCFKDAEGEQFLRMIRVLKGWKSCQFDHNGNGSPPGIGLTIAAGRLFRPEVAIDAVSMNPTFDDRKALRTLVDSMIRNFSMTLSVDKSGTLAERLVARLPVTPYEDVFTKMTDGQMATFKQRLTKLRDVLDEVEREEDPVEACKTMQKLFGDRFPVPAKEDTAQTRGPAISSAGVSS